jgi:hypothetical protein
MAGDWIKMRSDLFTHPKVVRMSSALQADTLRTVGGLMSAWCLFDAHSIDGELEGYSFSTLDAHVRWEGFSAAMASVKWLVDTGQSLVLPEFNTHNGASAKRRAQDADRKRNVRKESASEADKMRTREEKRREENITITVPGKPETPECPHQEIINLYHELLPTATQIRIWNDARRKHLQARWREDADRQNLDWWRRFFAYCSRSQFLSGQVPPSNGHAQFVLGLDWIVNPTNFAKIIEGRYHEASA